jgi:hypothetical protein
MLRVHRRPVNSRPLGIPIGSGDVESRIKQVGAHIKLPKARLLLQNVPGMLRLRCAHLNRSDAISICTHS